MKEWLEPELEIEVFSVEDVMTSSDPFYNPSEDMPWH